MVWNMLNSSCEIESLIGGEEGSAIFGGLETEESGFVGVNYWGLRVGFYMDE